jgi:hypothetical protein
MNLDEQLRAVLNQEAEMQTPTRPDIDGLVIGGQARRRRRRTTLIGTGAAAAVFVGGGVYGVAQIDRDAGSQPPITKQPTQSSESSPAAEDLQAALAADAYGSAASDFNDGPTPSSQGLAGLWLLRAPYGPAPLVVDGDGDWGYGLFPGPDAVGGSSTLDGRTWTRNFASPCSGISKLPWRASIAGDGSLHLDFRGQTNVCTPADDREVWDRLVPGPSPVMDFLRETSDQIDWRAPAKWQWAGTYVDPATGHVLDIGEDGSYRYLSAVTGDQLAPTRRGVLDPEDATQPGAMSGSCGDGSFTASYEVGQTPAVAGYLLPHDAVKITPVGEACSHDIGAARIWVKVSWTG